MRELTGWTAQEPEQKPQAADNEPQHLGARYNETINLLTEWGIWSRGGLGLHYRSPLGIIKDMQLGTTVRAAQITDETADKVDRVVARLRPRYADLHRVLVLTYCAGMSQREVARSMRIQGQMAARDLLNRAVPLVDMLLFDQVA